ncbi:MAG: DUF2752 domain-containing protein [Clostridia bacterium]|nr:DUF2752 domain-containing protein [Clostridia bacterium]
MDGRRKRILAAVITTGCVAALYLSIGCPIRFFTGVSCPSCGISRALLACLRLDFADAFRLHPAVFLLPVAAGLLLWKRKNRRFCYAVAFGFCAVLFIVWLARMFAGSEIVYFRPAEGVIYKTLRSVFQWLSQK